MANQSRKQKFFEEDTEHGRVKRIMYKKYMQAYIEKTQCEKYTLRTMIIDGFAGAGRYGNDWPSEIENYGSPLIALMVALGVYHKRYILKEKKKERNEANEGEGADVEKETTGNMETNETTKECPQSDSLENKNDTSKNSLWGWPSSELDPDAELSNELKIWNRRRCGVTRPAKMSLIFIENDRKRYKKLTENVELLIIKFFKKFYPSYVYGFSEAKTKDLVQFLLQTDPFSISVKIINRKFGETEPPLELNDPVVRSLTFLDPFGFTQTPMAHVAKFTPGIGNEVLINFMSSYVNRFVSKSTEGVVQLYGMSDYENVAREYGIDPPELEDEYALADFVKNIIHSSQLDHERKSNNIIRCTENYEKFLKRKTNSKYSLKFEVKNKKDITLYHMVHITNHIRGVEAMKKSMNRCSQRKGEMIMSDYDIVRKGLKLNLGNLDDPTKVADAIFMRYKGRKQVLLEEIKNYILFETNFVIVKRPLAKIQREGKITDVVDIRGNRQRIRNKFPDEDRKTKEPIIWLISFSDEDHVEMKPDTATLEKQRKREERLENSKRRRERKRQMQELKAERLKEKAKKREEQKMEIREKKRRREEERLQKRRKKEERRRQIAENKRKRDEAKREKQRRKEEQEAEKMRSQQLITEMFPRTPTAADERLMKGKPGSATFHNREETTSEIAESIGKRLKNHGKKTRAEKENENKRKEITQRRITDDFVSQKSVAEGAVKANNTCKRKLNTASAGNGQSKNKRVKVTSESVPSTSNSQTDAHKNNKGQKVLTEYFQPQNKSEVPKSNSSHSTGQ